METTRHYQLPDGTRTDSYNTYRVAWGEYLNPLTDWLDMDLVTVRAGIQFTDGRRQENMSRWLVDKLLVLLAERERLAARLAETEAR